MRTLQQFADTLRLAKAEQGLSAIELASRTGLTPLAIRKILAADAAPRLTNAMALAEELGFELILVPKNLAQSLSATGEGERTVFTDLERRLGQVANPSTSR